MVGRRKINLISLWKGTWCYPSLQCVQTFPTRLFCLCMYFSTNWKQAAHLVLPDMKCAVLSCPFLKWDKFTSFGVYLWSLLLKMTLTAVALCIVDVLMEGESSCSTLDYLCVYALIALKNEITVLCLCDIIKENVSDVTNSRLRVVEWVALIRFLFSKCHY